MTYTWGGHTNKQGNWTKTEHGPGARRRGLFFLPFCPFLDLANKRVLHLQSGTRVSVFVNLPDFRPLSH